MSAIVFHPAPRRAIRAKKTRVFGAFFWTLRGHISKSYLLAGVVAALAALVFLAVSVSAPSDAGISPASAAKSVVVQEGDSLSVIAARELPSLPVQTGVSRLMLVNNLSSTHISVGSSLVIPDIAALP